MSGMQNIRGDCDGDSHLIKGYNDEDSDSVLMEILNVIFDTEDEKFGYQLHFKHPCTAASLGVLFTRLCNLRSITFILSNPCDVMLKILDRAALHQRPSHQAFPFPFLVIAKLRDAHGDL